MLNPIITPPRVPLVDSDTGLISRAWYLFFVSLNNVANAVVDDAIVGPSTESLIASYDALLQTLAQEVQTQPSSNDLVSQIAELQKQVEALQVTPAVAFGTMAFENTGVSGSVVLAKITGLGADGSLNFTNGIITAYVAPT